MKNSYKITILGEQYTIVSTESEKKIHQAAAMLDAMMKEIFDKSGVDLKRIAILAALQLAHKLITSEEEKAEQTQMLSMLANRIESECKILFQN